MRVKMLTGRNAGEIQDVRLDAAQALLASGQAVEVKDDEPAEGEQKPEGDEQQRALGTRDFETATDDAPEHAVLKTGRGKKSGGA